MWDEINGSIISTYLYVNTPMVKWLSCLPSIPGSKRHGFDSRSAYLTFEIHFFISQPAI